MLRITIFILATLLPITAAAELRVVATTGDLAAMALAIVADDGEVQTLVRPGEDPHFVDPRPSFARHLNRADMLLYVGLDLEVGWLPALITRARNPKIQAGLPGHFDASRHIQAADLPRGPVDRSMGDVHPHGNPHYTTDPRQMARVALAFGDALGEVAPDRAAEFKERAREFARDCIRLAQRTEQRFDELPEAARRVITYHNSWPYVTRWLRLENLIHIEPRPGVPPNPRHVARVVEIIEDQGVNVILQLDYYPHSTSQTLAQRTGATLVVVPAQTRDNESYFEHIEAIVEPLFDALTKGSTP